ncbi:low-temperature-induced 65 kDa protein-like [Telopea speciosissima]|uniref:low-temperature-induced 65 kDa protein-like n=1 Tax=Telopea speciosissima TaxID=54955 RepID=UPI001CC3F512|nr:low-temperature-induced 65 kDa protein-like [Telopea speciosissima]
MAQMERMQRQMESRTTPNTPTVEHLLNEDNGWSAPTTPSLGMYEEDHGGQHSRKSVLAKVKEKAKRLKHTLSKKKHNHDDNATPSWGVKLEDEDQADVEPEYLGAPMYESEMVSEACKESSGQQPRANSVISDKHVVANNITTHCEEEHDKDKDKNKDKVLDDPAAKNKSFTQTVTDKLAPACATITATLAPAYATVSEATNLIASKIHISTSSNADNTNTNSVGSTSTRAGSNEHLWDKGVSMKEYLMYKLEPGEDEKALSQVIAEAISPRKAQSGGDNREVGVVGKVRGVVSSLLWSNNDSSSSGLTTTTTTANNASTNIPVSTNASTGAIMFS